MKIHKSTPHDADGACTPWVLRVPRGMGVLALAASMGLTAPATGVAQAQASVPVIFKDADLGLGRQLIAEHKCAECHVRKVGGDGSAIYRPKGRINSAGFLRGMVEQCNSELNLGLFPDEVTAVAAVLNLDHYRFR